MGPSLLPLFAYPLLCLPFRLFHLHSLYVSWLSGGLSREALREACPFANASQFLDTPIPIKLGQHRKDALFQIGIHQTISFQSENTVQEVFRRTGR